MFKIQKDDIPSRVETLVTEAAFSNSYEEEELSSLSISRIPVFLYHRGVCEQEITHF